MIARVRFIALFAGLALTLAPVAARAGFVLVNMDGPGEGFNDTTLATPVGGNLGTTIGEQRINVFNRAAAIWDAILQSPVTIRVQASFDTIFCGPNSGALGFGGPNVVDADFLGSNFQATWYASAEANRLSGVDLDPDEDDITVAFNLLLGTPGCLETRFWYYGFDDDEGANGADLLPVVLHELGHGLGFLTFTDGQTGALFGGLPMISDRYLMDDVTGKHWYEMTDAERLAGMRTGGHPVWDGLAVNDAAPGVLGKRARVLTSGAITGDFTSGQGVFYPTLTAAGVTGQVVIVNDGIGDPADGCSTPFANATAVAGKIAFMNVTGLVGCTLPQQAANAEANGAIGVIFANNVFNAPEPQLRGAAPTVSIPVTGLSRTDGDALRTALASGAVTATLSLDVTKIAGMDNLSVNRMRMAEGNVSHFNAAAFPNLLMEPSANPDQSVNVDLTYHLFYDIGWFPQLTGVPGATNPRGLAFVHGPNPTSDGGTLRFRLARSQRVELSLFDLAGRRIARLADGVMDAGEHDVRWARTDDRGHRVAAGIYRARLRAGGEEQTLSVVLID